MARPIRLGKAAGEFSIGMSTLVDYLESKGVNIDPSPNTKLTPEQYELLRAEFATDQAHRTDVFREKRETISLRDKSKEEPQETEPFLEEKPQEKEIEVVGKIDLSSINTKTRSSSERDSKDEIRTTNDEIKQIDVWKAHIEAQELLLTSLPPFYLDPESLSEISRGHYKARLDFSKYRELAEDYVNKLFKNKEGIEVDIEKGILSVPDNITIDLDYFNNIYESALSNYVKLYNQPAVMFRVDAEKTEEDCWSQIADNEREGVIEAKRGIAYLTITEIERALGANNGIKINDQFGAVLNSVKPSFEFYRYAFDQVAVKFSDFRADEIKNSFFVYNQWLNEKQMNEIFSMGLFECINIELAIKIEDNEYLFEDQGHLVFIENDEGKFTGNSYRRNLGVLLKKDSDYLVNEPIIQLPNPHPNGYFLFRVDSTIHPRNFSLFRKQLLDKLKSVFGNSVKAQYRYVFKPKRLFDQNLKGWKDYIQQILPEDIQYYSRQNVISFDFQSKRELENKVKTLKNIPFLDTEESFGSDYYYKASYSFDSELNYLQDTIKGHYPTINIVPTANKKSLVCSLHYESGDVYSKSIVLNKLNTEVAEFLNSNSLNLKMISDNEDRDYYPIEFRSDYIESDLSGLLRKIRGDSFGIKKDKRFEPIAKLFKVKYPYVFFDTTEYSSRFELQEIVPFYGNFKGDQDKLKRLKSTIDKIYSDKGSRCLNPRVKDFMHDASTLHAEEDLERLQEYLDLKDEVSSNLLGKRVNEKQLEAIAKSLYAKDLFVIQGPPGTGKSTGISEITWQHIRQNELSDKRKNNFKILITSETNLAVDNALDKLRSQEHVLIKPARFGSEEKLDKEGLRFSIPHIDKWVASAFVEDFIDNEDDPDEDIIEDAQDVSEILQTNIVRDWMHQIINRSRKVNASTESEYLKFWNSYLSEPDLETRTLFRNSYVKGVNVVGSTCSTIGRTSSTGRPTSFFQDYCSVYHPHKQARSVRTIEFDVAIQDEASKASPPELAIPMVYARKNIVLGDHRQLPPLVNPDDFIDEIELAGQKSKDPDKADQVTKLVKFIRKERNNFNESHFERIYSKIHPSLKTSFNEQYRMHSSINNVIRQFYINDNGLECGLDYTVSNLPDVNNPSSRYHGINIPGIINENHHVLWVNTSTAESIDAASRSRYNIGEIEVINKLLELLTNNQSFQNYNKNLNNKEDKEIGVITFYGAQLKRMRSIKDSYTELDLRISSVDRFQGMERNIVIISAVRSNKLATYDGQPIEETIKQTGLGFADSPNRLNVALSRAKRLVIIVGNSTHFTSESHGQKSLIYRNVLKEILNDTRGHCHFIDSSKLFDE